MPQFTVTNFQGTRNFGPINVPQGISGAKISLDGSTMLDPALRGSLQMDISLDNGVTWSSQQPGPDTNPFPVLVDFLGGQTDKYGNPVAAYDRTCEMPHPELTTRQLRAQLVNNSGVPLNTTATLTAV